MSNNKRTSVNISAVCTSIHRVKEKLPLTANCCPQWTRDCSRLFFPKVQHIFENIKNMTQKYQNELAPLWNLMFHPVRCVSTGARCEDSRSEKGLRRGTTTKTTKRRNSHGRRSYPPTRVLGRQLKKMRSSFLLQSSAQVRHSSRTGTRSGSVKL